MFLMGLVFQLPLVIMGLAKIGVVTSRALWGWTVAVPMIVLYFLGMLLARLVEGNAFIRDR
jgi:Sec-independent protein secretion pathway component TatC